jgi:hypothetical protein
MSGGQRALAGALERHGGRGLAGGGVAVLAELPAVRLQQGEVVYRVAAHERQFAAHSGCHRKLEFTAQAGPAAYQQERVVRGRGCRQPVLDGQQAAASQAGAVLERAVARSLVRRAP